MCGGLPVTMSLSFFGTSAMAPRAMSHITSSMPSEPASRT